MAVDLGDLAPDLSILVTDNTTGALANASTVTLTITKPDGSTTTPTVTNGTTGVYTATYTTTLAGYHTVRWVAAGNNCDAAYTDAFNVEASTVEPIVSLAEAKTFLGIHDTGTDEQLRDVLDVASQMCEDRMRTVYRRQTVTEAHSGDGSTTLYLRKSPAISITSVTVNGSTVTDYVLEGRNGMLHRGTTLVPYIWWPGQENISVTYVAGPAAGYIPANILHGTRQLVRHLWNYQRGGSGLPRQQGVDSGFDPRSGFTIPNAVREAWGEPVPLVR